MKKWLYVGLLLLGMILPSSVQADNYGMVILNA